MKINIDGFSLFIILTVFSIILAIGINAKYSIKKKDLCESLGYQYVSDKCLDVKEIKISLDNKGGLINESN